jgi:hypothetical protein
MSEAKAEADSQACYGKLTREQQEKMNNAMMEIVKSMAAVSGAAGGPGGAPSAPNVSEAMAKSKEFTDRICQCADTRDAECAKKVQGDMQAWAANNADKMRDYKPTAEEQQQAGAIAQKMTGCMQRMLQ